MDALILAGGKGERYGKGEKPLLEILGKPMIQWVSDALEKSMVERIFVVTSPYTEKTKGWAKERGMEVIETPGKGYVEDLRVVLSKAKLKNSVLLINSDLPLISHSIINGIIEKYEEKGKDALSVWIPSSLCRKIGKKVFGKEVPAGINIIRADREEQEEYRLILKNIELAFNIDTEEDKKKLIDFLKRR
jgi:adenosylcobinamide-phosphate guanylyltransferase